MTVPGPRFTYEDYKYLPDEKRYQIIEGELLALPTPPIRHQAILGHLSVKLYLFAAAGSLGSVLPAPLDVILSDENVVQPDILFVAHERAAILDPQGGVHGAPDLVVEILSPSTAGRDQVLKRKLYGKYGVREYWLVDPDAQSISVLTLREGGLEPWLTFPVGATLRSPALPGFELAVTAELFH